MSLNACLLQSLLEVGNFEQAAAIIQENPTCAALTGGAYGSLPLLVALMHKPPLDFVEALIEAYPDALAMKNDVGMLPLRVAIRNAASTDVIMKLIDKYPDAVASVGVTGKTCLHLACIHHTDNSVVERLIKLAQAASVKDNQGWYPLHMASICKARTPTFVPSFGRIPKQHSNLAVPMENYHSTWQHFRVPPSKHSTPYTMPILKPSVFVLTRTDGYHSIWPVKDSNTRIDSILMDQYRAGAEYRGKHSGALPLHIAAKNGCHSKVLDLLVEAYPEATHMKCYAGKTPLAYDASHHLMDLMTTSNTTTTTTTGAAAMAH
ncbi:hypothetical protein MHU86_15077 [Fragilaria crotonensis]|nr:hypothetical protein MHU86_15077 [Fragilaria crotonensis]